MKVQHSNAKTDEKSEVAIVPWKKGNAFGGKGCRIVILQRKETHEWTQNHGKRVNGTSEDSRDRTHGSACTFFVVGPPVDGGIPQRELEKAQQECGTGNRRHDDQGVLAGSRIQSPVLT